MSSEINHGSRKHALLSASKASQWIACTPSPRLEEKYAPEDSKSSFAAEGELAHELGELLIRSKLTGKLDSNKYEYIQAHELYSDEMLGYCEEYADYVLATYNEALAFTPDALLLVEQKVDLTSVIPKGFGTCDVVVIADKTMYIIDLKYGMGVRVDAEDNAQLRLYAYGAYLEASTLYDIQEVRMCIYQPRVNNISWATMTVNNLKDWVEQVVKPKARLAFLGEGECVAGSHCKWCKVKPRCNAYSNRVLDVTQRKDDFQDEPKLMSDERMCEVLHIADVVEEWVKTLKDYAYAQAMSGKDWQGFKLIQGRSVRQWIDESQTLETLQQEGLSLEQVCNTKLKGIGDIEKALASKIGKLPMADVIDKLVAKSTPALKLVPSSTKGEEVKINSALEEFKEFINQ